MIERQAALQVQPGTGVGGHALLQCAVIEVLAKTTPAAEWGRTRINTGTSQTHTGFMPTGSQPKALSQEFPGAPVVNTLCSHSQGPGFSPWLGS